MVSIDILPNDVLLEIFDFYQSEEVGSAPDDSCPCTNKAIEAWQTLVHVCQRWRNIVFGSPSGLDLQLVCTTKTPARETLDVWPALPLCIRCDGEYQTESVDNINAVLERSDRVVDIKLDNIGRDLEKVLVAMLKPFPELTELDLEAHRDDGLSRVEAMPVLPNSFLGGSAPSLEVLWLNGIPFPGVPNLLLSAPYLVDLHLRNIPHYGYFSPGAMLTALSTLTSLKYFWLEFDSSQMWSSQRPALPTHSVLPALTHFCFRGITGYLRDLVAHIDAPQLGCFSVLFYDQIEFGTPQLDQFICRTPRLKALENASVTYDREDEATRVSLWQPSFPEQDCISGSVLFDWEDCGDLYICEVPGLQDNLENRRWLELLHPFTSVKNLYLSEELVTIIVPALQELVGGRTTEVLPILQKIFLEGLQPSGPVHEAIGQFISTQQLTSYPIAVTHWEKNKKVVKDDD